MWQMDTLVRQIGDRGKIEARATLSFYTIVDCHCLPQQLTNIAAIAITFCQNDRVGPG